MKENAMRNNKLEMITGGALAAISGAALATYLYKSKHRTYKRKFDPSSVEEAEGRVVDILYSGRKNREDRGVELILETHDDLVSVHVGPAWYIDRQRYRFKPGDKIRVKGSRVHHNHNSVLIAETIFQGSMAARLRDAGGNPFWSAWSKI